MEHTVVSKEEVIKKFWIPEEDSKNKASNITIGKYYEVVWDTRDDEEVIFDDNGDMSLVFLTHNGRYEEITEQLKSEKSSEEVLNYNEVFAFMREFQADLINRYNELIIDQPTNTYASLEGCKNLLDVKTRVVFALCRPIGKGLSQGSAERLLKKLNTYFESNLTKADMLLMYQELCYSSKFEAFKDFVERGFPMHELSEKETN